MQKISQSPSACNYWISTAVGVSVSLTDKSLCAAALPHDELPLVWFTAEVLKRLWKRRRDGKVCRLFEVRAELEAAVNLVRRTKFGIMAPLLDSMMEE